jgi:hypothetical protein
MVRTFVHVGPAAHKDDPWHRLDLSRGLGRACVRTVTCIVERGACISGLGYVMNQQLCEASSTLCSSPDAFFGVRTSFAYIDFTPLFGVNAGCIP